MKKFMLFIMLILFSTAVSAVNVIITADELYDEAYRLADFHGNTDVVNISSIESYPEADNNDYIGYNNQNIEGADSIAGYNYSLARKIISFLRGKSYDSVTLFGDGKLVPPSYYFYNDVGVDVYDKWIPTDFFYSSTNYDLVPENIVGRIPVMDEEEADNYIKKVMSWEEKDKVVAAGGKITGSVFYEGELAVIDSLNKGYFGEDVEKYLESDSKFSSYELEDYFSEGGAGLMYIAGHGDGDDMIFSRGRINSQQIMMYGEDYDVPVIISVLCNNGAFDTRLTARSYSKSFGESIIASKAGGIAYIGAARFSYGVPEYDDGEIKKGYITELIDYVLAGEGSLGERVKEAAKEFVMKNEMSDKYNLRTLFELSLLGDPQIALKSRKSGKEKPVLSVEESDGFVTVKSSETAYMKAIDVNRNSVVRSEMGADELTFDYSENDVYMIKADNGKEARIYLGADEGEEVEKVVVRKVYIEDDEDRKNHDVRITRAGLRNDVLKCGRQTKLDITIENKGENDEEVSLAVSSPGLGIDAVKNIRIGDMDEFDISYSLDFPDADEGEYIIDVDVYDSYGVFDSEKIRLTVEDCVLMKEAEEINMIVEEEVFVQELKEKNAEAEDRFLEAIRTILLAGAAMFIIMFIVMKPKHLNKKQK